MLNETMRESPLIYFHDCASGNNLPKAGTYSSIEVAPKLVAREQHYWNHLNLRGDANAEDFFQAVSGILGISLPLEPGRYNSAVGKDGMIEHRLYWLGPDEWLLISQQRANQLENKLRETLKGHVSITDVTGGQTLLNLSGDDDAIQTVLKKSSVYNFDAWESAGDLGGRCAHTTFGKTSALVSNKKNGSYDLVIRRSFSDYCALWLLDAGREFGICILGPEVIQDKVSTQP